MVNFFWPGEKGPNLRFYCFLLYEKKIGWTKKPSQEFYFVTLKNHANFGITLNAAFHIISPKNIGQFILTGWKGSKFEILFLCLVWKVNYLNQKTLTGVLFCDTEEPWKVWRKTESCFLNQSTKAPSPPSSPPPNKKKKKIDQFLSSGRKVPKFHILLLDFVWKENCLNQKTFTRVLLGDTKELWKVWDKTKCWFPNQHPKNWSICFQLPKRVQISTFSGFFCLKGTLLEPKTLTQVLVSETEGLWKVWAKTEC